MISFDSFIIRDDIPIYLQILRHVKRGIVSGAVKNGDERVAYIDGYAMFSGDNADVYTVDGTHPNDAGFLRMADVIGLEVKRMLAKWADK